MACAFMALLQRRTYGKKMCAFCIRQKRLVKISIDTNYKSRYVFNPLTFSSSTCTRSPSATTAQRTLSGAPVMRTMSLWSSAGGIEILTSWSSIMRLTSRPFWPMMKRWKSYGTLTSSVIGTFDCRGTGHLLKKLDYK